MKEILKRMLNGEELSISETYNILIGITRDEYPLEQITAWLTALQMRGITVDELLGLRKAILETGKSVKINSDRFIDIVGTGGDGKNTFNVSTCACFIVAGAGYKVVKHGNYSATSISGASNVLEGHGVIFTSDVDKINRSLDESGFAYLHAPLFATAMKYVAPIRRALQIPTCFNLLGPVVNPAQPPCQLLGVANLDQMRLYSNLSQRINIDYCIVNSIDGYDEISLTNDFKIMMNGYEKIFKVSELGFDKIKPKSIYGGKTKEEAIGIFDAVLNNAATNEQKAVVVVNAAFAIHTLDKTLNILECLDKANESVDSGKALEAFKRFVNLNS